jgi:hypothetical protein
VGVGVFVIGVVAVVVLLQVRVPCICRRLP